MKTQRRHELKVNSLSLALAHWPDTVKRYGAMAITVLLASALVTLLVRYRLTSTNQRLARVVDNLAVSREDIDEIKRLVTVAAMVPDVSQATELFRDTASRLDAVQADAGSDEKLSAEALVARGDLDWYMAGVVSSTTQPTGIPQNQSDLLKASQTAYQQVVSGYPQQTLSVSTARLGLAAIAEENKDWDGASKQYQAVIDDADASDAFKKLAGVLQRELGQLEHPLVLGSLSTSASTPPPSTRPSLFGPIQ
jgi:hypothetical protein